MNNLSESDYLSLHILTKLYPLLGFPSSFQSIQNLIFQHFPAKNAPLSLQEKLIYYTIHKKGKETRQAEEEVKKRVEGESQEEEERRVVREEKRLAKDRIRKMNIFRFITENNLGGEMGRILGSLIEQKEKQELPLEINKQKEKTAQIIKFSDLYPEKTFKCNHNYFYNETSFIKIFYLFINFI